MLMIDCLQTRPSLNITSDPAGFEILFGDYCNLGTGIHAADSVQNILWCTADQSLERMGRKQAKSWIWFRSDAQRMEANKKPSYVLGPTLPSYCGRLFKFVNPPLPLGLFFSLMAILWLQLIFGY